ncbi:MAG: hypothetical protein LBC62_02485, partial [Treponema sp.]|nr:hypothetical protein [Treponema sp.]
RQRSLKKPPYSSLYRLSLPDEFVPKLTEFWNKLECINDTTGCYIDQLHFFKILHISVCFAKNGGSSLLRQKTLI